MFFDMQAGPQILGMETAPDYPFTSQPGQAVRERIVLAGAGSNEVVMGGSPDRQE